MLRKHTIITNIVRVGVVAIIRTDFPERAIGIMDACVEGGISAAEFTFTTKGALHILEQACAKKEDEIMIGAGTVLDAETARIAILSGASYIVSPNFDRDTALVCNRYATPYMAGCYTPTEMVHAMEYGVEIIKLFPSNTLAPGTLKAFLAPLPHVHIMPTGGINLDNAKEWIAAGAVVLGIGAALTGNAHAGNFAQVTESARAYVRAVAEARDHK